MALMAVIEWMKRYFMPERMAGRTSGIVIDVKVFTDEAPRLRLASSIEGSIWESAADASRRITEDVCRNQDVDRAG